MALNPWRDHPLPTRRPASPMGRVTRLPAPLLPMTALPVRPTEVTAAGYRIDTCGAALAEGRPGGPARKWGSPERWQDDAWAHYDLVGAVKYALGTFLPNCHRRLRVYPAVVVDPDEPPVYLGDVAADPGLLADVGLPAGIADDADLLLAELEPEEGGIGALLAANGIGRSVSGDGYIVQRLVAPDVYDTRFYSERQVRRDRRRPTVVGVDGRENPRLETIDKPGQRTGDPIDPATDLVMRVYRPHAAWSGLADSNLRGVLAACEETLMIERATRAELRSRVPGGLVTWPEELDHAAAPTLTPQDPGFDPTIDYQPGEVGATQVKVPSVQFMEHMATAIADEGTAADYAPFLLRLPAQYADKVRHIVLARPLSAELLKRSVHNLTVLGIGLNVPPEVITGYANVKYSNAWAISDSTYANHVEPDAQAIIDTWCTHYLRPGLIAMGHTAASARRVVLAIDPSKLVVRPNRAQDAKDVFDRVALSEEALRKNTGFSEKDAPSEEEWRRRVEGDEETPASDEGGVDEGGDTEPDETEPQGASADLRSSTFALSANGGVPRGTLDRLGERLARIDQALTDRLTVAADAEVVATVKLAGARLRTAVQADAAMRAKVKGLAACDVGRAVTAAAAPLTGDELLDGAFDDLHDRWDTWVTAAAEQADALAVTAGAAREELAVGEFDNRDAGWAILLAALREAALSALYDPTPDGDVFLGEAEPGTRVNAGPVRQALGRAGGDLLSERPVGGVATGPRVIGALATSGVVVTSYRWSWGGAARPFEPHMALDGREFTGWEDDSLRAGAGFPYVTWYRPNDHAGCTCSAVPSFSVVPASVPVAAGR